MIGGREEWIMYKLSRCFSMFSYEAIELINWLKYVLSAVTVYCSEGSYRFIETKASWSSNSFYFFWIWRKHVFLSLCLSRQDSGRQHPTSFSHNPINRISTQRRSSQVGLIGLHYAKQAQCNRNSIPRTADDWLEKHFTSLSKFRKK